MNDGTAKFPAAELHETHISIVFLVGDRAAKLKKPVCFPFVDLSTRAAREAMCHREVVLNRRLAPDVYLGVFDIVGPDGSPSDHLVMMRRMPDARRLSHLVRSGAVPDGAVRDLAHVIASFHTRAETSHAVDEAGRANQVAHRWDEGFAEIAPLLRDPTVRAIEHEIEARVRRYLAGRRTLFDERITQGRIRDGHGDLLADDVFLLDDGPRVLDCLEFDDELRYGDILADVAFLAMDLEHLGAPGLARELLACHRELTDDTYPETLAHHYLALRAHIRAKVSALRSQQGDPDAAEESDRLLVLAAEHARRTRIALTLVGGAPGTGKSTLAAGIGDALAWVVLRSDDVRKDLAGIGHLDRTGAALDHGIYTEAHTVATYRALLKRAGTLLERGEPVVLDASWADESFRADARRLAESTSADLIELHCDIDAETAARRTWERARHGRDPSDATPEISREIRSRFDAWPSAHIVATDGPPRASVAAALEAVHASDPNVSRDPSRSARTDD